MDTQLNDALLLLGMKELEISYLRKQVADLTAALRATAQADPDPAKPNWSR